MKISSTNFLTKSIGKKLEAFSKNKHMIKFYENAYQNPAKYASRLLVLSLVSKDAINWLFYVVQSIRNKEIPEEKRTLVTSLDFMNGFFNIGGQIASSILIERNVIPLLESSYTGVIENPITNEKQYVKSNAPLTKDRICGELKGLIKEKSDEIKRLGKGLTSEELLKHENFEPLLKTIVKKTGVESTRGKAYKTAAGLIITTLGTTALIKRTITPLCATPLAVKFNNWYFVPRREARKKAEAAKAQGQTEPKLDIIESEALYRNNKVNGDDKKTATNKLAS